MPQDNIPTKGHLKESEETKIDYEEALKALDDSIKFEDALKEKITQRIKAEVRKTNINKRTAKKAFERFNLSKVSAEIRKEPTYFAKGDDLQSAQRSIMSSQISRLTAAGLAGTKKGLRVKLSEDGANTFKLLNLPLSEELTWAEMVEALATHLPPNKTVFSELFYEVVSQCASRVRAAESIDTVITPKESAATVPSTEPEMPEAIETGTVLPSADEQIGRNISLQMDNATAPEESVKFGVTKRASEEDISDITKTFELRGGPADVTSYHDFYDLQMAFKPIWTELFDAVIGTSGEALYNDWVKVQDDYGVEADVDTVDSREDLENLMSAYRSSLFAISEKDPCYENVKSTFPHIILTKEQWYLLDASEKMWLCRSAAKVTKLRWEGQNTSVKAIEESVKFLLGTAKKKSRVENFLEDLEDRLKGKYIFDVFVPDSINFGILVNYKQRWRPLNYQVGELVSTIPLAPKEVRKYTTKKIVKKNRAVKEIENSLQIRKKESAETARVDAEIVREAQNKTNFKMTAEGGVNFEVWNAKGSHNIEVDAARQSKDTKKEFREAVLKSAEEYKQEHRLEIDTTMAEEIEETTSGEISNPNDELAVTYLFYELQRAYEISEKIHKITPVILVANEVPSPNEIDEDWLLAHDWILKRVILDDSFLPALDYLSKSFVSDEISVEVLRDKMLMQMELVKNLGKNLKISVTTLERARSAMEKAMQAYAASTVEVDRGWWADVGEWLFWGGGADVTEAERIRMEAAKEAFGRAEREKTELKSLLESEITALEVATDKFIKCVQDQYDRRTAILRLRAHVKDYILYYMQAIWDQEPPDQRFFRLYNICVPDISIQGMNVSITSGGPNNPLGTSGDDIGSGFNLGVTPVAEIELKKLIEVADLDNLLGYKGNYLIFPLKKNNAITMYMMQDYIEIDELAHLRDPDEMGNYTSDELLAIWRCLYEENPGLFTEEFKESCKDLLIKRLSDPYREKDMVIVPTNSLYIEALPGKHPILEDFKLVHRAVDVKKVQAEVRHAELENVRLAARVLKGEYEDPDIEKKIVVEGDTKNVVINPDS